MTALLANDGGLYKVKELKSGTKIRAYDNTVVNVVDLQVHPKQLCSVVTVQTRHSQLVVSEDHRIFCRVGRIGSGTGVEYVKLARDLKEDDEIPVCGWDEDDKCAPTYHRVTKVRVTKHEVELCEVQLDPDWPVRVFHVPAKSICALGNELRDDILCGDEDIVFVDRGNDFYASDTE